MTQPLLQVEDLRAYVKTPRGVVKAVDGVSFSIDEAKTLAIVGESGCGKSMTALALLQLLPEPAGYIETGRILYRGRDLLDLTWEEMRAVRGKEIAMIFQEPMTSLNPVLTIAQQLIEAARVHGTPTAAARKRALELLDRVHIDDPHRVMGQYPHQLSGGMRQRVMIACALMNSPSFLIADEPTTALDVTVQAQILDLLAELQREMRMAVLLISHDLGIVAELADHVAVMYAGQIVENAPAAEVYQNPKHPYTRGLFASLPSRQQRGKDLVTLEGIVPDPVRWPVGCRFAARCAERFEDCTRIPPELADVGQATANGAPHLARCLRYEPCYPKEVARQPGLEVVQ
jgi:oligopeptide/dipeptide ABC transporter ATP-binding protein